jgi:hypothetical protein
MAAGVSSRGNAMPKPMSADAPEPARETVQGAPSAARTALRSDPYERADITSNTYYDWLMSDGAGVFIAAPPVVGQFLAMFKDYPPSQRPSSFSIDQIVEKMQRSFEGASQ